MMNKNTVVRVSAPNTTKAEKRRRGAITEREREERRPRLKRANPKAVPLTREAYREITDPSKGQGNDERFLSDAALTALTAAAGATSVPAAVASTVPLALKFRSDLENLGVETALTDPNNLMLLAGMIRGPGTVRQTRWYHDLVNRYGTRDAEAAAKFISTDAFKNFFWQGDPASVVRESGMYSTVRDIIKKIGGSPDEGKALIGGSASINKFGTIHRPSAVAHDLDIDSYIGGASKRPWEPIPGPEDYVTDAWYDKFVSPLERPGAVEASPILQRIREQFPKTHANAPILEWDDAMWKDNVANRYKEGVFQKINNFPDVYPQFTGRQFIGTRINGVPVDIFLADTKINQVPGSVYAPPETAFGYKRMYAEENALHGRPPRPKDVADFESYRPFSRENPVVDPETGRAQFSPSNFGDQILTEENLPAVSNVETYPGSGEAVPMIMNTRGQMVYPFSDAVLRQDAKGGTSRRDADVAKEAEKIRGTRIRVEGDHGAVRGTVAEVADLAPAAQRGRIENAIEADAANRARRAEYDRLAAENRGLVGEAGLARYDELITKGRPDARSQTSDALAYALRDNPVLAPESRSNLPFSRPTHDKNGHPLTYVQDSKWVPDANPRTTRRESSADREFREATHVPTGVTIIGDQKFTTYADGTIGDTTAEHIREARESKALSEALLRQDVEVVPSFQKDYRYTDPLFTSDGQQRIKDIVGKTSPLPESGELTNGPDKFVPGWTPPDLNPKPYYPEARESEKILLRQDAKGGDAGGEVTENAEIVNSGEAADPPVTNGPRIVINPTTFRNGKDALCVAFNERFRIWMEAKGFNPQSEPTEKQREFFNDTAYADDELMLRRTILARIATLDTSVKDPTDAQITETLEMLKGFRETERPDDAWQANAIDRIIGLVQSVEPAERATPQPT